MSGIITVTDRHGRLQSLEFENGHLVKVDGMRPMYMDGQRLIRLVSTLADELARRETVK